MGLANRFLPYSVNLATAGGTTAWINQIESTSPEAGITLFEETSGSETDRQYVAEKQLMPTVPITTSDLTALTTVGIGGVFISPASGSPGAQIFGRLLPLGSLPAAIGSSVHLVCAVSDGLLVPQSLRASNNEVAKLQLVLHATLGTTATYSNNKPLLYSTAQTIPSGQTATTNIYTNGPVKFTISGGSSVLCQGISQTGVDFGIQVQKESTDGEAYPSEIAIIGRNPKVEFTTKDPTLLATIGDGVSVSAFAAYFRAVNQNGQRITAATASHVSVAGTAGMITPGSLNLTHKRSGEARFVYTPSFSGSAIITVSAAAAIPTS